MSERERSAPYAYDPAPSDDGLPTEKAKLTIILVDLDRRREPIVYKHAKRISRWKRSRRQP